jgi:phosphoglucomutase
MWWPGDLAIPCFETPTGWKFFGNLLDAGRITLCGEESFGTGSNHIREKDGLWAVLFWLQILATRRCTVAEVMADHWAASAATTTPATITKRSPARRPMASTSGSRACCPPWWGSVSPAVRSPPPTTSAYTDPVDGSLTSGQGLRVLLEDGSRVVLRLSGTGTKGATLRVYLESYVPAGGNLDQDPQVALGEMIQAIDGLAEIRTRTGMDRPTVIT